MKKIIICAELSENYDGTFSWNECNEVDYNSHIYDGDIIEFLRDNLNGELLILNDDKNNDDSENYISYEDYLSCIDDGDFNYIISNYSKGNIHNNIGDLYLWQRAFYDKSKWILSEMYWTEEEED